MKKLAACLALLLATVATLAAEPAHAALELIRVREVAPGIFRGSRPETMGDLLQLKQMGIRTIYNLVTAKDDIRWEREYAAELGIRMVSIPMHPWVVPSDRKINHILEEIQDPANQPIYLHCRHGKDRTGLIFGIFRVEVQGWDAREAYDEMRDIGFTPWLAALEYAYWRRVGHLSADSPLAQH